MTATPRMPFTTFRMVTVAREVISIFVVFNSRLKNERVKFPRLVAYAIRTPLRMMARVNSNKPEPVLLISETNFVERDFTLSGFSCKNAFRSEDAFCHELYALFPMSGQFFTFSPGGGMVRFPAWYSFNTCLASDPVLTAKNTPGTMNTASTTIVIIMDAHAPRPPRNFFNRTCSGYSATANMPAHSRGLMNGLRILKQNIRRIARAVN